MGTHPTKKNQSQCSWFLIWLIVLLSLYNYSLDTVLSKRTFPPTERLNLTPSCVERNVTFTQAVQMGNNQNCIFKNFRILFLFYFYFIGRHFAVIIHFCILYSINVSMTELFTLDIKIKFLYNPTLGVNVQFLDLNLLTTSTCLVWTCTRRSVIQLHAVQQVGQVQCMACPQQLWCCINQSKGRLGLDCGDLKPNSVAKNYHTRTKQRNKEKRSRKQVWLVTAWRKKYVTVSLHQRL
jgi:hypothetical protein